MEWTKQDSTLARSRGWDIHHVWDLKSEAIVPVVMHEPGSELKSDAEALKLVIITAGNVFSSDALSQKALQIITKGKTK